MNPGLMTVFWRMMQLIKQIEQIDQTKQQFLNNLDKTLWISAEKLRSTLDASQYKHAVPGLLFVKYVSDSFEIRQAQFPEQFKKPEHDDYYLEPADSTVLIESLGHCQIAIHSFKKR